MAKVTGLGGLFFKAEDTDKTREWYARHLGIPFTEWGGWGWEWRHRDDPGHVGRTKWSFNLIRTDSVGLSALKARRGSQ